MLTPKSALSSSENPHTSTEMQELGPLERSKMKQLGPLERSKMEQLGPLERSKMEQLGPLERSKMNEEPPNSFRFTDLAAEIRNQIYRCILIQRNQPVKFAKYQGGPTLKDLAIIFTNRVIYSETMPIFLSDNAFSITGTRKEQTWLRRMRPEGRSELRDVTLVVNESGYKHDFNLYNALSLCPQVRLTLKVRPYRLVELSEEKSLRHMHGYVPFDFETFTSLLGSIFGVLGVTYHIVGVQFRFICHLFGADSPCAPADSLITFAKCHVLVAIQSVLFNSVSSSRGST